MYFDYSQYFQRIIDKLDLLIENQGYITNNIAETNNLLIQTNTLFSELIVFSGVLLVLFSCFMLYYFLRNTYKGRRIL